MLAASTGQGMPEGIGVILGDRTEIEFRIEDFIHYYRSFLQMQTTFSGNRDDCPEPLPLAEHGRWIGDACKTTANAISSNLTNWAERAVESKALPLQLVSVVAFGLGALIAVVFGYILW